MSQNAITNAITSQTTGSAISDAITGTTVTSLADYIQQATQTAIPSGSITDPNAITVDKLAPNNYLTIVWKDKATGSIYNTYEDIDSSQADDLTYTTQLNNAINNALTTTNTAYAGNTRYINVESIAKYLSQNILPSGTKRVVIDALINIITGDRAKITNEAINLTVNVFGEIAKKVARKIGFTDPHEAFASITSENTITFLYELGKASKEKIEEFVANKLNRQISKTNTKTSDSNNVKYVGLLLGITTSDTESYEITIPRRKVENGSDYTTHLLPQPFKKEFNVVLTNKILSSRYDYEREIDNIEKVKNKLIEIAKSYTTFDIYIRLSSGHMYKKTNVVFSSLSFTKDEGSGNNYTCSFTIEPIEEFLTKTFISDRKYFPSVKNGGSGAGNSGGYGSGKYGISGRSGTSTSTRGTGTTKNGGRSTNGKSLKYYNWFDNAGRGGRGNTVHGDFKTVSQAIQYVKNVNKTQGENYNLIHFVGGKDLGVGRQDLVPLTKTLFVTTKEGYYVPKAYTKKITYGIFGYDINTGGYRKGVTYTLADGVSYNSKNKTFSTKNSEFKIYNTAQSNAVISKYSRNEVIKGAT